jgi:hypothetical protein
MVVGTVSLSRVPGGSPNARRYGQGALAIGHAEFGGGKLIERDSLGLAQRFGYNPNVPRDYPNCARIVHSPYFRLSSRYFGY